MAKRKTKKNKRIVVGLSGGIDSSVSLILLREQGWDPIGVYLKLPRWKKAKDTSSKQSLDIARRVCQKFKIPFFPLSVKTDFRKTVVKYFLAEIKASRTPNPCVICNRYFKIKQLFDFAEQHGINYVSTGHYARIIKNKGTGKYQLAIAKDKEKDQTYYLSLLPYKWLKNIVFPLGIYTKEYVYKIARENHLGFLLNKKESQDFCFLRNSSINEFLKTKVGEQPGEIKDTQGRVLGRHNGLYFYTIGQRRNIRLSGGPYFVVRKDPKNNILFVTKKEKELEIRNIIVKNVHWITCQPKDNRGLKAKIRYKSPFVAISSLKKSSRMSYKVTFREPQRAITPGQFCVFYKKDICLGGGEIE